MMNALYLLALEVTPQWAGIILTMLLFFLTQAFILFKWASNISSKVDRAIGELERVTTEMHNCSSDMRKVFTNLAEHGVKVEGLMGLMVRVGSMEERLTRVEVRLEGKEGTGARL